MIKDVFNNFGDMIKYFDISFLRIDENDGKEIIDVLNDNSAHSLKSFEIRHLKGKLIDCLKNTFEKVTFLLFSIDLKNSLEINDKDRKLSQIFPNVESLNLYDVEDDHWAFIDSKFPRLTKLFAEVFRRQPSNCEDEKNTAKFLQKNSQIESLRLSYYSESDNLPSQDDCQGDMIHFEHIKDLELSTIYNAGFPRKMVFNKIEKLVLHDESSDEWSKFIYNQGNITLSTFYLFSKNVTAIQFLDIADKFPNVSDVIVADHGPSLIWTADDIVNFVKKCKHLQSLHIEFGKNNLNEEYIKYKLSGYGIFFNKIFQNELRSITIISPIPR